MNLMESKEEIAEMTSDEIFALMTNRMDSVSDQELFDDAGNMDTTARFNISAAYNDVKHYSNALMLKRKNLNTKLKVAKGTEAKMIEHEIRQINVYEHDFSPYFIAGQLLGEKDLSWDEEEDRELLTMGANHHFFFPKMLKSFGKIYNPKATDFNELMEKAISLTRDKSSKEIKINLDLSGIQQEGDRHLYLPIDEGYFIRAVKNFLGNGLQNLLENKNKLKEKGQINVSAEQRRDAEGNLLLNIKIQDNGTGLPETFTDIDGQVKDFHLFEEGNTTRREKDGTGLGTTIAKKIVDMHEGQIRYSSSRTAPNNGTTIEIELPMISQFYTHLNEDKFVTSEPREMEITGHEVSFNPYTVKVKVLGKEGVKKSTLTGLINKFVSEFISAGIIEGEPTPVPLKSLDPLIDKIKHFRLDLDANDGVVEHRVLATVEPPFFSMTPAMQISACGGFRGEGFVNPMEVSDPTQLTDSLRRILNHSVGRSAHPKQRGKHFTTKPHK